MVCELTIRIFCVCLFGNLGETNEINENFFTAVSAAFCSTIVLAYTPGTYTASVAGQNGPVAVEVQTSADKILSVKVSDQKETQNIGTHAVEQLPAKIVEAQSADVPAVSGASRYIKSN